MNLAVRVGGWLLLAALLMLGAAALFHHEMERALARPIALSQPALFTIAPGSTLFDVARKLAQNGWISDPLFVEVHARLAGTATRIQAGTYEVIAGDTPGSLFLRLYRGDTKTFPITFVEGVRFAEMRALLAAARHLQQTIDAKTDAEVMAALGRPETSPEGLFFPSTYRYAAGSRDVDLLARALRKMQAELDLQWQRRAASQPYDSPYEALIMASIIEKETGRVDERHEIAGVFARRLAAGMKLQTDPTVIYGLGENFDGNLRRRDLSRDTPYNTYTRHGLPPTPIAMPGAAAIAAALNPTAGKSLYFVAKGDGSHKFSVTLKEHNAAVRQYQLNR